MCMIYVFCYLSLIISLAFILFVFKSYMVKHISLHFLTSNAFFPLSYFASKIPLQSSFFPFLLVFRHLHCHCLNSQFVISIINQVSLIIHYYFFNTLWITILFVFAFKEEGNQLSIHSNLLCLGFHESISTQYPIFNSIKLIKIASISYFLAFNFIHISYWSYLNYLHHECFNMLVHTSFS